METAPAIDVAALKAAREAAELTQHELARQVGVVGGERISMWERGTARPRSPRLLHAVARAVNLAPRDLLVRPDDGPTLRWLRFAAGVGLEELADATHVSVASLKRWEAHGCRRLPSPATIEMLASALDVATDDVTNALRRP
jgi:transcriptional regulator with XRE-family HTH domain